MSGKIRVVSTNRLVRFYTGKLLRYNVSVLVPIVNMRATRKRIV